MGSKNTRPLITWNNEYRSIFVIELLGKSREQLRDFCQSLGEPAYRGGQIYHALYAERKSDVRQMTNLPAALRRRIAAEARITLPSVKQKYTSQDGSIRYLFVLPDGSGESGEDGGDAPRAPRRPARRR